MKNKYITLLILCFSTILLTGQYKAKIELNKGVKAYQEGNYKEAQEHFENSFTENPSYGKAIYNAGNAAYLDGDFDAAREYYNTYINTIQTNTEKAEALHNIGNSYLKNYKEKQDEKSLIESINYYKNSLRENPLDQETRYNLAYALNQLQQKQENKKEKKGDKDEEKNKKEENKDQNSEEENKEEQGDKEQQKENQEEDKDSKNEQNQEKDNEKEEEKKGEMSQKQIDKNLDAVNNDEQKILMKVNRQKGDKKKTTNQVKDW